MLNRAICLLTVIALATPLYSQERSKPPQRDAALLDVLTRVVAAAGGSHAVASIHDLTESGEITFFWGDGVKGPVTIRTLGGNHFRMEADLPEGRSTWVVNNGDGSRTEADRKPVPISGENAINFGNLTLPVAHLAVALTDATSDVSLMGIEKRRGRSVYRLRVKGQLGLSSKADIGSSVVKDVLVDALNFEIVSVEDYPYPVYQLNGKLSDTPPREIEYGDFRVVDGVRIPFSISTKLQGQQVMSIRLSSVVFNSNLGEADFKGMMN
jgi:hypothetical protein